jgi:purine-binding chemotaxis protein CheW
MNKGTHASPTPDDREILRIRARALALQPEHAADPESAIELLEFRLAQERYALETSHVHEVVPLTGLTPLPCTPPFLTGIVNVRGCIVPVIDLKKFFNVADQGLTNLHRIILVRGHGLELGLLADAIVGVCSLPVESLQPSLATISGIGAAYLKGVTAESLVVLDLDRILLDPKIIVHEDVEGQT